jgi:hypothetical protein
MAASAVVQGGEARVRPGDRLSPVNQKSLVMKTIGPLLAAAGVVAALASPLAANAQGMHGFHGGGFHAAAFHGGFQGGGFQGGGFHGGFREGGFHGGGGWRGGDHDGGWRGYGYGHRYGYGYGYHRFGYGYGYGWAAPYYYGAPWLYAAPAPAYYEGYVSEAPPPVTAPPPAESYAPAYHPTAVSPYRETRVVHRHVVRHVRHLTSCVATRR